MNTNLPDKKIQNNIRDPRLNRLPPQPQQINPSTRVSVRPESSSPPEEIDDQLPDATTASANKNIMTCHSSPKSTIVPKVSTSATKQKIQQNPISTNQNVEKSSSKNPVIKQQDAKEDLDKQLGFGRPTSTQIRAQIEEVMRKLKDFSLADCRDKVHWLTTIIQQQQFDLDLYRTCSFAVEKSTILSLKQLSKLNRNYSIVYGEKKNFMEQLKQRTKEKKELEIMKAELSKGNDDLRKEIKTLMPFKTNCEVLEKENKKLRKEKDDFQKQIDQNIAEREKSKKLLDSKMASEISIGKEMDELKKKIAEMHTKEIRMKQRIRETEENLAEARKSTKTSNKEKDEDADATLRQLKKELAAKNGNLDKAVNELNAKQEEYDELKHKAMELRAKLTQRKEDLRTAKESSKKLEEELQVQKERSEQEIAKLQKELRKMATVSKANKSQGEPAIIATKITMQLGERLQELRIKKEEMDRAIVEMASKSKECKNCHQLRMELAKIQDQNQELISACKVKDAKIAELGTEATRVKNVPIKMVDPNIRPKFVVTATNKVQEKEKHSKKRPRGTSFEEAINPQDISSNKRSKSGPVEELQLPTTQPGAGSIDSGVQQVTPVDLNTRSSPSSTLAKEKTKKKKSRLVNLEAPTSSNEFILSRENPTPLLRTASPVISPISPLASPLIRKSSPSVIAGVNIIPLECSSSTSTIPHPASTNIAISDGNLQQLPHQLQISTPLTSGLSTCSVSAANLAASPAAPSIPISAPSTPQYPTLRKALQPTIRPVAGIQPLGQAMPRPILPSQSVPSSPTITAHHQPQSPQINQPQMVAARIVTSFMLFIGQNVNRDARTLIPEFLQKFNLPPNHLIADQLYTIANEAEKAKK